MIEESFSIRLLKAMQKKNIKASELAEISKVPKSAISQYLSGLFEPKQKTIFKLAKALNVSESWLIGLDVPMGRKINIQNNSSQLNINQKHTLPILGTVRAGYNHLADENIIGHVTVDREFSDYDNYYALKIIGDSMEPVLYEGDIVIVHRQSDIENGQIGVVLLNGDEATIKKIKKHNGFIELIPFNHNYDSIILTDKDNFLLLGKIVEARITKVFE